MVKSKRMNPVSSPIATQILALRHFHVAPRWRGVCAFRGGYPGNYEPVAHSTLSSWSCLTMAESR